jgi:hypothetical protein
MRYKQRDLFSILAERPQKGNVYKYLTAPAEETRTVYASAVHNRTIIECGTVSGMNIFRANRNT